MNCPKCGGMVINDFGDQRCFSCGCRPNAEPVRDLEPDEPIELTSAGRLGISRQKRSADEVMKLVMTEVLARRGKPKKEEDEMASSTNGICSKKTCEEPAAPDSVMCVKHRDQKKASNDAQRERRLKMAVGGGAVSKETKTSARRGPKLKLKTTLPAVRQPHVVDAVPVSVGELDSALIALEADRVTLERAKQILERMRS